MVATSGIFEQFSAKVIGQDSALLQIVPYVDMYQARLSPGGRPAGIFLLLGPTGIGKTRTVEALAAVLHENEKNVLRIDCGEFQMDHEVSKLIGAPPGYLGHRDTVAILCQKNLTTINSGKSGLSLVLFDEIEKAALSMRRILLGIMDKASLRLGDNSVVNFENTMIFMTSNLGAREIQKELSSGFGFGKVVAEEGRIESIGSTVVKREFSPEFINRIDVIITYQPLDHAALVQILDLELAMLQKHIKLRLEDRGFDLEFSEESRAFLLKNGTSAVYGARHLKRAITRYVTHPLAIVIKNGDIPSDSLVRVCGDMEKLNFVITSPPSPPSQPDLQSDPQVTPQPEELHSLAAG